MDIDRIRFGSAKDLFFDESLFHVAIESLRDKIAETLAAAGFVQWLVHEHRHPGLWEVWCRHSTRTDLDFADVATACVRAAVGAYGFEFNDRETFALCNVDGSYLVSVILYSRIDGQLDADGRRLVCSFVSN